MKALSELDDYMTSVNGKETTLNEFVRLEINSLTAGGETSRCDG